VNTDRRDARLNGLLIERIHQRLVVETPRKFGRRERIADGVALPRIRFVGRDRHVDLVHPAGLLGRYDGVGEQPLRPGEFIDHIARLYDLRVGQKPPRRIVERRAGEQRKLSIAVVVHFLDVVEELEPGQARRFLILDLRIPVCRREVVQAEEFLVIEIVAHEVSVHIDDELPRHALSPRQSQLGLVGLGGVDLEYVGAVDLFESKEGGGHAAAGRHELPTAQAELLAILVGQFEHPALDVLLRLTLPRRQVLTVGNNLGRYGGRSRSRLGPRDKALFSFAKPTAH